MLSSLLQKIGAPLAGMDDTLKGCGLPVMSLGVANSMRWCTIRVYTSSLCLSIWRRLKRAARKLSTLNSISVIAKFSNGIGDSENTVALQYRVVRTLASSTAVFEVQRLAARRIIERNRVLCIGNRAQKMRDFFVECIRIKQDGVACGRSQTDQEQ
ncbi:hypothetical protein GQ600_6393 [Phytophthora cactorum]|nr:hypothetical protein GQ600_6393 [Phytophthora cactorum]